MKPKVPQMPVKLLQQVAWLDFVGAGPLGRQAEAARGGFLFPTEWKRHVWKPDSLKSFDFAAINHG